MYRPESFREMRRIKFSGILRYNQITQSWPDLVSTDKKRNKKELTILEFPPDHRLNVENKQILGFCQRIKKSFGT